MTKNDSLILKLLEKIDAKTEKIDQKVEKVEEKCNSLEKRQIRHEEGVNSRLDIYNAELTRHIEGVEQNRVWNAEQDKRLQVLEKPSEAEVTGKTLKRWAIDLGKIGMGALGIFKGLELLKELFSKHF